MLCHINMVGGERKNYVIVSFFLLANHLMNVYTHSCFVSFLFLLLFLLLLLLLAVCVIAMRTIALYQLDC